MKYLLTIFFIATFFCASAQTKSTSSKVMTAQDSINVFVKQRTTFIDSLISKTTMKEFQLWLDENVSAKSMREGALNELWSTFTNVKLDEWIRKNKIVIPKN